MRVSVHRGGGLLRRGVCSRGVPGPGGGGSAPGGAWSRGVSAPGEVGIPACTPSPPGETATAADGTHPTGMHSCFC